MLSRLLLATLLATATAANPLAPSDLPYSVGSVTQFRSSGSGCTQSSDSVSRSGGWIQQTYTFREFEADTVSAAGDSTQNCELHFQGAGATPGWQVSIAEADAAGRLTLGKDATLNYYWQVYWSGDASDTLSLQGTIDSNDNISNPRYTIVQPATTRLWSKCIASDGNPGILNVNFRVAIIGDGGDFDVDTETLKYQWRKC